MAKRSSVFMIGWEYPPHNSGGLGVACQGLTQGLSEANTQIYFTLPHQIQGQVSHMKMVDCRHPEWDSDPTLPPFLAYDGSLLESKRELYKKLGAHDLASLPQSDLELKVSQYADVVSKVGSQKSRSYDLIHAHDWMSFPAAVELKKQTGKPMVAHVHSTEYDRIPGGGGSDFIMSAEQKGMKQADKVIAVSNYTKKLLVKHYAIDQDKIEVVHNGMTPSVTAPNPGWSHFAQSRPVVVFMGRLTGQKGPEYFLSLASQVLRKMPRVLFVVAGSGDLYHNLLLQTASKGMSAQVVFSGFVRDRQRETLLDRADIFVMPSLSEPFGLVALEAAERHTPVIVSESSGVKEVMKNAVVADFWDLDKMSQTIVELLENRNYHQDIVQKQLGDIKQATWQSAAQKVKDIYRKIFLGRQ